MDTEIIYGDLYVDLRGVVSFVNDFNFEGVQRFYTIRSHKEGVQRGWVGHKREHKWFIALSGTILIAVVAPDDFDSPSRDLAVQRFVLSSLKPAVLHVPPGCANASMTLTPDAHLGVFSSGKIGDAPSEEWRFDLAIWKITE